MRIKPCLILTLICCCFFSLLLSIPVANSKNVDLNSITTTAQDPTPSCSNIIDSSSSDKNTFSDETQHGSGPGDDFADCEITRVFARPIQSIQVILHAGDVIEVGYVGNIEVARSSTACESGSITTPIDVTSQVTVNGNKATFHLKAKRIYQDPHVTCTIGWGYKFFRLGCLATFHWNVTLATPPFSILSPRDKDIFVLDQSNLNQTTISFAAGDGGSSTANGAQVNFNASIMYRTSGNRCPDCNTTTSFVAPLNTPINQTFTSIGGQSAINANAVINGTPKTATPITIAITGTQIPDDMITARLLSLYKTGATPRLLTGLAQQESTYMQFKTRTLFGFSALWPNESFDGGSHIGLMMVPTTMPYAFDWMANTAEGSRVLIEDKLPAAKRNMTKIIQMHPGLRQLTNVELENMAVLLYGPYAPKSDLLKNQYYTVKQMAKTFVWIENTSGNPSGVQYVKDVRNKIR